MGAVSFELRDQPVLPVQVGLHDRGVNQERGLVRTEYESSTLRGNLGLQVPENRYTKARESALLRL